MGEPNDEAWGPKVPGPEESKLEAPSSSPGNDYCDTNSSHNDSDGVLSSLSNDDSRSRRTHNANTPGRSTESSEGSLSSSSSDDLVKKKSHVVGSEGSYERVSHSEISCRKRKSQPVSVASSSPSPAIQTGSSVVVAGSSGIKEPNELPSKKSRPIVAGSKLAKDGKRSSRKKKDINLATVEGQLAVNPGLSEEEARAAAKREYHRQNAALARVRNKEMVTQLKRTVSDLTRRSTDLQRANDVLRSQLEILSKQNADLVKNRTVRTANVLAAAPTAPPPETSPVARLPAVAPPSNDPSALLLLQLMSSLLQVPQGPLHFAPQGANLLDSLLKLQAPLMNQAQVPLAPVNGIDPVLVGQMLAMFQGQLPQPQVSPSIVPSQQLPSPSPAQPILQAQTSNAVSANRSTQALPVSPPQVASEHQRLEVLLGHPLGSSSTSQQESVSRLPQSSTPATLPVQPAVVSDTKRTQQESTMLRNVSSSVSTPTPASTDPSSLRITALAAGPPSTNEASSSDLQASQLMLLLRSLSQNTTGTQPR